MQEKKSFSHNCSLILFSTTLLISSTLLFWLQPLFTKAILPILGGTPNVWNTAMVCFQLLLLAGYWYADRITKLRLPSTQAILHIAVVFIAVLWIWLLPPTIQGTADAYLAPISWQLNTLLTHIGIPFFLLATTSTLLQRWYADIRPKDEIYWLYSVSNIGSMLGVLGFIILIEPFIGLIQQATLFKWSFTVLGISLIGCAWFFGRQKVIHTHETDSNITPLSWQKKCRWILLAAAPSGLLLGTTTHITMDIAPVPMIWMLLLALYLISFIVAFSKWKRLSLVFLLKIQLILCVPLLFDFFLDIVSGTGIEMMFWHMATFFVTATVCHRLLYESRPHSNQLTTFYLYLSIGGAVGGVFTNFVAPLFFNSLLEYPLLFALAFMLRPSTTPVGSTWLKDLGIASAIFAGLTILFYSAQSLLNPFNNGIVGVLLMLAIFLIKFCFDQKDRPIRLGLCYTAAIMAGVVLADIRGKTAEEERNFYGIVTVDRSDPESFSMRHGTTTHGAQYIKEEKRLIPLTYFHPSGPLGDLMKPLTERKQPLNIAVIGLGVGSIACYGRTGDEVSFFEINPAVITLANDTRYFSYLHDCAPTVKIITGDGRISIEHTQQKFDLFVLDAFTSDSIPVHLLTREAFNSYEKHLTSDGVMFVHISNRYLDLARVLRATAHAEGMAIKIFTDKDSSQDRYKQRSTWAVMGKQENIEKLNLPAHWDIISPNAPSTLWTDDYSNILSLM